MKSLKQSGSRSIVSNEHQRQMRLAVGHYFQPNRGTARQRDCGLCSTLPLPIRGMVESGEYGDPMVTPTIDDGAF